MIEKNTVLILGAGASSPFGFPLGRELANQIADSLFEPTETELGQLLLDWCPLFPSRHLKDFAARLHDSHRDSVDVFLEHNSIFLDVGRISIAATLIRFEEPDALQDGDWYRNLFNAMQTPFADVEKNKLGVITYNYDRSLEYYLCDKLRYAYGKDIAECRSKMSSIPIVHLHGKMGNFLETSDSGNYRNYNQRVNFGTVIMSARNIKIIHESIGHEPQFVEAQRLIKDAEVVCFLGFGFDEKNIERLLKPSGILNGKKVFCSAFKLPPARVERAKDVLGRNAQIKWGSDDEDCLTFLQNHRVLI